MTSRIGSNHFVASRILRECIYGASKTRITHQSSPKSLKIESYLYLILNGYIEVIVDGPRVIHKTTPKGLSLMEKFDLLHGEMDKLTRNTYA